MYLNPRIQTELQNQQRQQNMVPVERAYRQNLDANRQAMRVNDPLGSWTDWTGQYAEQNQVPVQGPAPQVQVQPQQQGQYQQPQQQVPPAPSLSPQEQASLGEAAFKYGIGQGLPGQASAYAQPQDTASVPINNPQVKVPEGRGKELPGGGYQVGNATYRSAEDFADQRVQEIFRRMQQAAGPVAPLLTDQTPEGYLLQAQFQQQQQGRNAGMFAQAMQAAGEEDRQDLARQLGLGDLNVKRGQLQLGADTARANQAGERAKIASAELMQGRELGSKADLTGRELASRESIARMGGQVDLEKARMTGAAELARTIAQQKLLTQGALASQLVGASGDLLSAGTGQAKDRLDAIRAVSEYAGGGGYDVGSLVPSMNPNPQIMALLSGRAPAGQGGTIPVAGSPPAVTVGGGVPGAGVTVAPQRKEGNPLDALNKAAEQHAQYLPINDVLREIGAAYNPQGSTYDYTNLKGKKADFVAEKLAPILERVNPQDFPAILRHMQNAGMGSEDLRGGLSKNLVYLNRALRDQGEQFTVDDPGLQAGGRQGFLNFSRYFSPFQALAEGGGSNDLTIRDAQGNPVLSGREDAGLLGIPQYLSGTGRFFPVLPAQRPEMVKRRRATEALLQAYLQRPGPK